ncbi:MAG: ATP-binding protein [Planctomycetota bacterium]|jgi:two-component system phosphate regulon sensor histidine kinase PhoR
MIRSKFFWKLFGWYALLIFISVGAIGVLVHQKYSRNLEDQVRVDLRNLAVALGELSQDDFSGVDPLYLQERVEAVGQRTDRRITMIARNGEVLADSDAVAAEMEDHLEGRVETRDALAHGEGYARRRSETTGEETFYVAVCRDHESDRGGLVRIAVLAESLNQKEAEVARLLLLAALIASLPALLIGAFVVRRITTPLVRMRDVALEMGGGDYAAAQALPPEVFRGEEMIDLANSLQQLGRYISQQVADLTAGQERVRAMVAGMVEGVIAVDDQERMVFSNHAARRLLGLDDQDPDPTSWQDGHLAGLVQLVNQVRDSGLPAGRELELSESDETAIVHAKADSFHDGDSVGVVVVLNDVSEIRRLERVRRDFVANVSHELKTPLTSIRGYVEALLDGAIEDEARSVRFLEIIEKNVLRLNHLVMDLLSLARIEENLDGPVLQPMELVGFVEEGIRQRESAAMGREQQLSMKCVEGTLLVLADREAARQIFDNLLDNALKYTPTGGEIVVSLRRSGGKAVLAVSDNGIGIPAADQARIFERFYRVDKARSLEVGGTGLGLSIVKHLVQCLDGTIELDSTPGVGSTFRVFLNLAPVD